MDSFKDTDAQSASDNPYTAPQAKVAEFRSIDAQGKASRGSRLAAILLDAVPPLVIALVCLPILFLGGGVTQGESMNVLGIVMIGLMVLAMLGYAVYQFILLHRNGQTFGKKMMKIKIVRRDGSRAGLGRIFWLRMFVPGLISNIPLVGAVFALADPLFIFGEEQRCVHDMIADTIVINA